MAVSMAKPAGFVIFEDDSVVHCEVGKENWRPYEGGRTSAAGKGGRRRQVLGELARAGPHTDPDQENRQQGRISHQRRQHSHRQHRRQHGTTHTGRTHKHDDGRTAARGKLRPRTALGSVSAEGGEGNLASEDPRGAKRRMTYHRSIEVAVETEEAAPTASPPAPAPTAAGTDSARAATASKVRTKHKKGLSVRSDGSRGLGGSGSVFMLATESTSARRSRRPRTASSSSRRSSGRRPRGVTRRPRGLGLRTGVVGATRRQHSNAAIGMMR